MSAHLNIAEGTDVMGDRGDQKTHGEERDEEADGSEEQAAAGAIGKALMGHRVGDEVLVTTPNGGSYSIKITAIE